MVIFRKEVNIMEEDAAPVFIPECLTHPDIQQLGTVKSGVSRLRRKRWRGGSYKSDMGKMREVEHVLSFPLRHLA